VQRREATTGRRPVVSPPVPVFLGEDHHRAGFSNNSARYGTSCRTKLDRSTTLTAPRTQRLLVPRQSPPLSACPATDTRLPRRHSHGHGGRVEVFSPRPDGHSVPARNDEIVMCIPHASTTDWVASHGTGCASLYGCRISRQCRHGHAVQRSRAATATTLGAARGRVWHRKSSP
jgi:hypothetical protein